MEVAKHVLFYSAIGAGLGLCSLLLCFTTVSQYIQQPPTIDGFDDDGQYEQLAKNTLEKSQQTQIMN